MRRLLHAVLAERLARVVLRHRHLAADAVPPDGAAVDEVVDVPAEPLDERAGRLGGEAHHVDHHVGLEVADVMREHALGVLGLAIDGDLKDRFPRGVVDVRSSDAATQADHLVAGSNQSRDEERADVSGSPDHNNAHVDSLAHRPIGDDDGTAHPGTHRCLGQQAVPRRDDVRRVGQPRPRRVDPDHPRRARRGHQLRRHRRRLRAGRVGGDRRQGAAGRRDDIVLATKFHGPMGDDPNQQGSSRRWIMRAVEDSLRRLDTDWIDLYQVHRPRTDTDIEETLGALTDLVRQGKVRYIGSSTFPASQIVEAQWVARERRLQRFVTEQPAYSILVRAHRETTSCPPAQRHGMGVISYSPLTGGWLSGRWRKDAGPAGLLARRAGCRSASTSPGPPTSASSTPSSSSRSSPTRPASPSSRWRSPSCSTTRRSPRRSSVRAPWSSSRASSRRPTSCSTRRCSTGSTRSSPPGTTINPVDNSFDNPALRPAARRR